MNWSGTLGPDRRIGMIRPVRRAFEGSTPMAGHRTHSIAFRSWSSSAALRRSPSRIRACGVPAPRSSGGSPASCPSRRPWSCDPRSRQGEARGQSVELVPPYAPVLLAAPLEAVQPYSPDFLAEAAQCRVVVRPAVVAVVTGQDSRVFSGWTSTNMVLTAPWQQGTSLSDHQYCLDHSWNPRLPPAA